MNIDSDRASHRQQVESSCLTWVGYDAGTRVLDLTFRHGGVYRYFEVPPTLHESLLKAPSKGRFFAAELRDHFTCQRLSSSDSH
jgi:hypothetical protein